MVTQLVILWEQEDSNNAENISRQRCDLTLINTCLNLPKLPQSLPLPNTNTSINSEF